LIILKKREAEMNDTFSQNESPVRVKIAGQVIYELLKAIGDELAFAQRIGVSEHLTLQKKILTLAWSSCCY
jgi:hypothetical protein